MIRMSKSTTIRKAVKGRQRYSDANDSSGSGTSSMHKKDNENYFLAPVDRSFMTQAYEKNDWIRAIVDMKSERVSQVDFFPMPLDSIVKNGKESITDETKKAMESINNLILQPNADLESFSNIIKKASRDIDIYDIAGIQITRDKKSAGDTGKNQKPYGLYATISGEELYVNQKKNGTLPNKEAYLQVRNAKIIGRWDKVDMMRFSRVVRAGYSNGFSPISTVAASIMGDFEMLNYNLKFFENNAKPNMAFIFENLGFGKSHMALKKAKDWYQKELRGHPHMPLFMGSEKGNVKMHELTTTHKDMDFETLQLLLLSRIMSVYGMQPMVLGILTATTGKLNSEVQTEQFKRNAIIPAVKLISDTFNTVLIWNSANLGLKNIYLSNSELDIDDDKKQSEIDEAYLDRGVVTINQVRDRLQMPPVPWGDEPFVPLNYAPLSSLNEFQQAKIQSLADKAGEPKVDNNAAKTLNPTGLEKVEPTLIKEVFSEIVKEREKFYSKTFSLPSTNMMNASKRFGVKCIPTK